MKALRLEDELRLVDDAPVPRREGEALVQVIAAGICNTDLEIAKGYAGFRGTLGHEFVGRVVESPDGSLVGQRVVGEINAGCGDCKRCVDGDSRHCEFRTVLGIKNRDGAFAEYLALPVCNLIEAPDSLPDEIAVLVEPLAAALNIVERISLNSSSRVVVVGDGKLALLIVAALAQTGCLLAVLGKHEEKLELARAFGASETIIAPGIAKFVCSKFEVAIEASGSPSGLDSALNLVEPGGKVVLKSTHHGETKVDLARVVVNEITIIGSRCGRFQRAIDFLIQNRIDLRPLISRRLPLGEGLAAFNEASRPSTLKVILQML